MATFTAEILANPQPQANPDAFRQWMQPHEARVYNMALHLTGNAADAETVLVETFVQAGRQFERRAEGQRDFLWLARLALRESLCIMRSARGDLAGWIADQTTPLEARDREISPWIEKPESLFGPQQWQRILLAALTTLSPVDRAVFVLCQLEKFTAGEAAAVLSIDCLDVRLRLNRARISLRDRLDPICRVGARLQPRPQPQVGRSLRALAPRKGLRRAAVYL
jgi:RNA polymerase sigma-70 factor (ECF subfamily)